MIARVVVTSDVPQIWLRLHGEGCRRDECGEEQSGIGSEISH